MFTLPIGSATSLLEQLTGMLGGRYRAGFEEGVLELDNPAGNGHLRAVDLQPGLSTIIYNVTFHRNITFKLSGEESRPLYFLFCQQGHFFHQYEGQPERRKVEEFQNVIVTGSPAPRTIVHIPADTPLKISVIWLLRGSLGGAADGEDPRTTRRLRDILSGVQLGDSSAYFGALRPKTAEYVRLLIENTRPGVVGRLLTEAAILNILASQLAYYREAGQEPAQAQPLPSKDMETVMRLASEIVRSLDQPHTLESTAARSNLNVKKLQAGFRFLYGASVGNFIRDARLERARELLETSEMNVSEVVYAVGLSSRSHFTRAFARRYGIRPSDLLARLRP